MRQLFLSFFLVFFFSFSAQSNLYLRLSGHIHKATKRFVVMKTKAGIYQFDFKNVKSKDFKKQLMSLVGGQKISLDVPFGQKYTFKPNKGWESR